MSIELELEDDGRIRVRVDREGVQAVSDVVDPIDLIKNIAHEADLTCAEGLNQFTIMLPEKPEAEKELTGEPEAGESAQEDDNV